MNILVTNDDGIDSIGLHILARAMKPHGDITIVAPDKEYSGAGCSIGALHLARPDVHKAHVEGIDDAWSMSGPPALCVMIARLGAFDKTFDLVVSGINPGANVGRAVYMSGTIGATLSGRMGGVSGVAVSQATESWGIEGQGYEEMLVHQKWDTAAEVAAAAVGSLVSNMPEEATVLNINLPNCPVDELQGVTRTYVGVAPPRKMSSVNLRAQPGHEGSFHVDMNWGEPSDEPIDPNSDIGAIIAGNVSITALGHLRETDETQTNLAVQGIEHFLSR